MSDLWLVAGGNAEAERHANYLLSARTAAAGPMAFVLSASDPDEYQHREALMAERLDEAVSAAVGSDTGLFLDVRMALLSAMNADFVTVHQARVEAARQLQAREAARREAEQRTAALVASINEGVAKLAADSDWQNGPDGFGLYLNPSQTGKNCWAKIEQNAQGGFTATVFGLARNPEYDADPVLWRGRFSSITEAKSAVGEQLRTQATRKRAYGNCPYCGQPGCSPNCPGPDGGSTVCPECGGGAHIHKGRVQCNDPDGCGYGWEPKGYFDESHNASRRTAYSTWSEDDDEFDDGPEDEELCPVCGGPGNELGALGYTMHYRCRDCGWEWSITADVAGRYPQADDLTFESAKTASPFDNDLGKVQQAIEAIPGAVITESDGFTHLNMDVVPKDLADLYQRLMQYGYANGTVAKHKTASGQTCSDCGAAIERDPEGETNRGWHHNDGATHDHEAQPGSSKESAAKSDVCPKCGAHMSDVTVKGTSLKAKCNSCGWSGAKQKTSAWVRTRQPISVEGSVRDVTSWSTTQGDRDLTVVAADGGFTWAVFAQDQATPSLTGRAATLEAAQTAAAQDDEG